MHSKFVQYSGVLAVVLGDSELGVCIEMNRNSICIEQMVSLLSPCILHLCHQSSHLTPTTVQYIVRLQCISEVKITPYENPSIRKKGRIRTLLYKTSLYISTYFYLEV